MPLIAAASRTTTRATRLWLSKVEIAPAVRSATAKTAMIIITTSVTARWTFMNSSSLPAVESEGPRIVRVASVSSTQDVARELPIGSIVVADHQTQGRGRLERRWEAPAGTALLVSFVVRPGPVLSLAAGVAAAEACGEAVRLKWPNDLLLADRKLGGILVEVSGARAVCGIGVNLTWAPDGAALLGEDRDLLLERLRERMSHWLSQPAEAVLARWRELSATLGRLVRVDQGGRVMQGVAQGIGPHGELIVDGEAIPAGSVTHL